VILKTQFVLGRALSDAELAAMSAELPQWKVVQTLIADDPRYDPGYQGSEIVRDFKFATFVDAIDFMRQAAAQINVLDHHPRWENVFRTVTVHYTTFDIGHRVSDRDYKNAAMLERLYLEFIAVKRAG
jgi:pterin-4a-carbinolamine dehydratase